MSPVPQSGIKKNQAGVGVMANTVFPEDLSLDPSSHVGQLRTAFNSGSPEIECLLASKGTRTHVIPTHTCTFFFFFF